MDQFELRRHCRMAMRGVPERLGLSFADGSVEMRAKPSGHGTTNFEWRGYAAVYDQPFDMWDPRGEPYTEWVAQGACKRSLANPNLDVPFLIGHDSAGIALARTKSGTMKLSEDSHGLHVHVPSMDGRRADVQALASAVERGDQDEMSLAFVCNRQEWDDNFERRGVMEIDIHRGDVCSVVHGANSATAGAWMGPVEQLRFRRPAAIGGPAIVGRERRMPTQPYTRGADEAVTCPQCRSGNDASARYCDQCGTGLQPEAPYMASADDTQECRNGHWNAPDAKVCSQCGTSLVNDHDADDGYAVMGGYASGRLLEVLSVTKAERDKAKAAGNSLPDGSYPINNVAQLHSAAVLAASHHGDWKAAQALIRRRAKELGVDVTTLPGFGEQKSSARPLELRASAAEDVDEAAAPDIDAAAAQHEPVTATHTHVHQDRSGGTHTHEHTHAGDADHSHGHSAVVMVDDATGIPGEEQSLSTARRLELRLRELELDALASRR